MDILFKGAPTKYNNSELTRIFAETIHSPDFAPSEKKINFQVKVNPNRAGGVQSDGTGILTVPSKKIGTQLLKYLRTKPIEIAERKLRFFKNGFPPKGLALTLEKTPYVSPDIEEERKTKLLDLDVKFRVNFVQFGIFYQPTYPSNDAEPLSPRAFSVEWEGDYGKDSNGLLSFDYDHKLIRIDLGSELTETTRFSLVVKFSTIKEIATGHDGKPYICFDTLTPPIMERTEFHRTMTGDREQDNRKFKQRIGSLHEGHSIVAPYAHQLRIVLFQDTLRSFMDKCQTAGIGRSIILQSEKNNPIEASKLKGFFDHRELHNLHKKMTTLEWSVAFQLESLLHNGLLHTGDIKDLLPQVEALCQSHNRKSACFVGDLLRHYNEALQVRPSQESPLRCFQRIREDFVYSESHGFRCYHVTFTPSRMILEGPYATQSNRVIRQYKGHEDHFIRVDFRDENRLHYHWDREVDGAPFILERVGTTLKQGFVLAGRRFEFLAYSSSALREHAVWFINPFDLPDGGRITADSIRRSLGNFEGTKLLRCPSKYAARLAQAFTATDSSVNIPRNQWEEVPDLGSSPYLFTDGVGTISQKLADRIFKELIKDRRDSRIPTTPSAYQIRFLGYKGVVSVDPLLDKNQSGIQMRLRPSMRKFETTDEDDAPIEIAQAFEQPNTCYLNRPLVMLLEDVGVKKGTFQDLQDSAVASVRTVDDSISRFNEVLASHNLGSGYRLRQVMARLRDRYGMDWKSDSPGQTISMDNPFFSQLRQVAMNDVLRDIKHSARIPVPESYLLVGVADEGPAYQAAGCTNVFTLEKSQIYACVQKNNESECIWLEGSVSISRSPVAHPGDVQRVRAIGKPPADMLCLFSHLKNVVVLPSVGTRSLASCLGGGDVDGDMFSIICHDALLPTRFEDAANYESCGTYELDRDSTVEDICDFVVEYINSDVLGLLSDRLLVVADQSNQGMRDEDCIWLAGLCSQAVDYPKQGIAVNLDDNKLPRTLIRCKPNWHAAEVVSSGDTGYYESDRALGLLFQSPYITLDEPKPIRPVPPVQPRSDPITSTLLASVERHLGGSAFVDNHTSELQRLFRRYADELRYICAIHTLSDTPDVRLLEAEVVIGTILAKCLQKRWRKDRIYRMRLHASALVRDVQRNLIESVETTTTVSELIAGLQLAWSAWDLSLRRRNEFAANSFGLISLGIVFDCLDAIELRGG